MTARIDGGTVVTASSMASSSRLILCLANIQSGFLSDDFRVLPA